jgi:hypothetical protein
MCLSELVVSRSAIAVNTKEASMSGLRHLGVALFATLTFGMVATSAAIAVEAPEILPNPTAAAPDKFESSGGAGTIKTAKGEISCSSFAETGSFTSARKGTGTIKFNGCKSKGVACKTTGAGVEEIVISVTFELVDIEESSLLLLGELTTIEIEIRCLGFVIVITGEFLDEFNTEMFAAGNVGLVLVTEAKAKWAATGSVQAIKKCHLPKATCEGKTFELLANFGSGSEEAGFNQEATRKPLATWHIDY